MNFRIALAATMLACSTSAFAATVSVLTDPAAPTSNFDAPTNTARAGYDLTLSDDGSSVVGKIVQTGGLSDGAFANLYFDLNPSVKDGSDLGFEIGSNGVTAFVPGRNGLPGFNKVLDASLYNFSSLTTAGLTTLDFSLSNSLFTRPISGLIYYPNQTFESDVTLRLSQSLSYSVAGGDTYGATRLGSVNVGVAGVPKPASWALMLAGFGGIGFAMRRRAKVSVRFA